MIFLPSGRSDPSSVSGVVRMCLVNGLAISPFITSPPANKSVPPSWYRCLPYAKHLPHLLLVAQRRAARQVGVQRLLGALADVALAQPQDRLAEKVIGGGVVGVQVDGF